MLLKPGSENFGRRWVANMISSQCRIVSMQCRAISNNHRTL